MKFTSKYIFLFLVASIGICFANEAAQILPYYEQAPSYDYRIFSLTNVFAALIYMVIICAVAFNILLLKKKKNLSFGEMLFSFFMGMLGHSFIYLKIIDLDFSIYLLELSRFDVFAPIVLFSISLPYLFNKLQIFTPNSIVQSSSASKIPLEDFLAIASALKAEFEKGTEIFHENTIISKNNGWSYKKNGLQAEMFVRDDRFFYINDIAKIGYLKTKAAMVDLRNGETNASF